MLSSPLRAIHVESAPSTVHPTPVECPLWLLLLLLLLYSLQFTTEKFIDINVDFLGLDAGTYFFFSLSLRLSSSLHRLASRSAQSQLKVGRRESGEIYLTD